MTVFQNTHVNISLGEEHSLSDCFGSKSQDSSQRSVGELEFELRQSASTSNNRRSLEKVNDASGVEILGEDGDISTLLACDCVDTGISETNNN